MKALLLIDHGSRRAEANELLEQVATLARGKLTDEWVVHVAHMELADPSIAEGFRRCVEDGARTITVHPFMLAKGNHVIHDIPRLLVEAAAPYPAVSYRISEPLGTHPGIVDVILSRIDEANTTQG